MSYHMTFLEELRLPKLKTTLSEGNFLEPTQSSHRERRFIDDPNCTRLPQAQVSAAVSFPIGTAWSVPNVMPALSLGHLQASPFAAVSSRSLILPLSPGGCSSHNPSFSAFGHFVEVRTYVCSHALEYSIVKETVLMPVSIASSVLFFFLF